MTPQLYPSYLAPDAPPPVYRSTLLTKVTGVDDKVYGLDQPLVPPMYAPREQWAAVLKIKGMDILIDKPSAPEVFNDAMRLFQLNGEPFWFVNTWLNLNLQWIPRVAAKYRIVTIEQLEEISIIAP